MSMGYGKLTPTVFLGQTWTSWNTVRNSGQPPPGYKQVCLKEFSFMIGATSMHTGQQNRSGSVFRITFVSKVLLTIWYFMWVTNIFCKATDRRPRISMWWGKVNQHNVNGVWKTDSDGVSGANLDKLEYCKKFWPGTTRIQTSTPERILFHDRGNLNAYWSIKPVWLCVQGTQQGKLICNRISL